METTGAITLYAAHLLSQTGTVEAPAEAAEAATQTAAPVVAAGGSSVFSLVGQSGPIVTAVLVILIAFSVISWAIILFKTIQLKKAARASARFLDAFWNANDLADMYDQRAAFAASPIAKVFVAGYKELVRMHESRQGKSGQPHSLVESMSGLAPIERAMHRTASSEVTQLEALVPFLATTGSTAPFIGLFGTVWGIMNSFHEISAMKSASIAVVAPGISEALIATATGLAAAIPAVMAYNYFVARIRVLDGEISHFVSDFLNLVENSVPGVNDTAPDPQAQRRARATQHGA